MKLRRFASDVYESGIDGDMCDEPMKFTWKSGQLYLRNSRTRIPFRYGTACMTVSPQAILEVAIEVDGVVVHGYSGDCLPPSWFDKDPTKDFRQQVQEMMDASMQACEQFRESFSSPEWFFPGWLQVYHRQHERGRSQKWPDLLTSFGISLVERAVLDALCRAKRIPFGDAVRENLFGINAGLVHECLTTYSPGDWLPPQSRTSLYVRHTVGLGDPLTDDEVDRDVPADGFPRSLESYLVRHGQKYFKIKVSNRLDHDLERLTRIAKIVQTYRGDQYFITLDGNEQYHSIAELSELIEKIVASQQLATLWKNTVLIEQPLARAVALEEGLAGDLRQLCEQKPVIIDESDGALDAFPRAVQCGYRGVSTKNCKGPIKSILNAGLIWRLNQDHPGKFLMSAEDLCCVGVVPLQSDLCLVAMLGIEHVERNGHHYHPGLGYLPVSEQHAVLAAHGDLYERCGERVAPRLVNGKFRIGSLQCPGFGFAVIPNVQAMTPAEDWDFDSLYA